MPSDPDYDPTEFQDVLRDWMRRHGLSQMAAAQTVGISQGVLNRWLKPQGDSYLVKPTPDSLKKLQPHLGVPLIQLQRMTGNLSEADLEVLTKIKGTKPNNRLEAFISDIRAAWGPMEAAEPEALERAVDASRVMFNLHHGNARGKRARKSEPNDKADGSFRLLMPASA